MHDIHLSIVSHRQRPMVQMLLDDLARLPTRDRLQVTLTNNIADEPWPTLDLPFPCEVITNRQPLGFGANHNQAFRAAPLPAARRVFAVLNPDLRLPVDPFETLELRLSRDPGLGVIAPAVVTPDGAAEDSARELPTPSRLLRKLFGHLGRWPCDPADAPCHPDWVAGMCMLFPAPVFDAVGGFDTAYHLYYEDVDLCCRLWLAGYRVGFDPACSVVHDAQRASRRSGRYLAWHLASIGRFLMSDVYRRARHLHTARLR